jgi:MoaA/NifB/PqqE/SkfB family radical SAM enzyme
MTKQAVQLTRNGKSAIPNSSIGFDEKLGGAKLFAEKIETLQVNVGKLCNQACKHCHVDASPKRMEIMRRETIDECLRVLREFQIPTLDITGGAPEMIPDFRYFVLESGLMCRNLISVDWRGNLYDCDFNQMLELNLNEDLPQTIFDFDLEKLKNRPIVTANHCFGYTAGAGSSCGGIVA